MPTGRAQIQKQTKKKRQKSAPITKKRVTSQTGEGNKRSQFMHIKTRQLMKSVSSLERNKK